MISLKHHHKALKSLYGKGKFPNASNILSYTFASFKIKKNENIK